jgi:hypothetical protein
MLKYDHPISYLYNHIIPLIFLLNSDAELFIVVNYDYILEPYDKLYNPTEALGWNIIKIADNIVRIFGFGEFVDKDGSFFRLRNDIKYFIPSETHKEARPLVIQTKSLDIIDDFGQSTSCPSKPNVHESLTIIECITKDVFRAV